MSSARLVLVTAAIVALCASAGSSIVSRRDSTLAWDDGIAEETSVYLMGGGYGTAVSFVAPEWAHSVTAIQFFVVSGDGTERAARAAVWEPNGAFGAPHSPACQAVEFAVDSSYSGWLHVTLPEPVSLVDADAFPQGSFCVGLHWLTSDSSWLGLDLTEPIDYRTWVDLGGWWLCDEADVMIRAVVSDEYVSPVRDMSWARIKGLFR